MPWPICIANSRTRSSTATSNRRTSFSAQQGTIKLVDFGLVKLLDPNSPLTATAMKGIGTPQYAPPEQFAGAGYTDARSDPFSLGAMLYHLLTGYPPPTCINGRSHPSR